MSSKIVAFRFTVFVFLLLFAAARAGADVEREQAGAGGVVVTNPELVPLDDEDLPISPGADLSEKVNVLITEVRRLKTVAMRATLIVLMDMELAEKAKRGQMSVILSGGKLEKPVTCVADPFGTCVFIIEPLSEDEPSYGISIRERDFVVNEMDVRMKPGAVAVVPARRKNVIRPEMPRVPMPMDFSDIKSPELNVRIQAIQNIAENPPPEALETLLLALHDEDPGVSNGAAGALGKLYMQGYIPTGKMIELSRDVALHNKTSTPMLGDIARVPGPENTELLLSLLKEGSDEERRFAAGMIGYQGLDIAVPALIEALKDPNEWVRYHANEQLQYISRGRNYGEDAEAWRAWWDKAKASVESGSGPEK